MHVYTLGMEKGGVGKSTVAVNLAAGFAQAGLRILLIDLDVQGHASYWLGVPKRTVQAQESFLGVLNRRPLAESIHSTAENVDLVPAHDDLVALPSMLMTAPNNGLFVLRRALDQLASERPYDVVVVDLGPVRGAILATALAAATRCIAPVQAEDLVLQSFRDLVDSVEDACQINPKLRGLSVLRNKYSTRGSLDQVFDQALQAEYGVNLLQTVIPVRAPIRYAAASQQSVFGYSGADAEVRGYFVSLVSELINLDGVV
jgi:chromosome partitioning protein